MPKYGVSQPAENMGLPKQVRKYLQGNGVFVLLKVGRNGFRRLPTTTSGMGNTGNSISHQ